MLADDLALLIL